MPLIDIFVFSPAQTVLKCLENIFPGYYFTKPVDNSPISHVEIGSDDDKTAMLMVEEELPGMTNVYGHLREDWSRERLAIELSQMVCSVVLVGNLEVSDDMERYQEGKYTGSVKLRDMIS